MVVTRPSPSPPRSRRLRRLVPLLVLAAGAFVGGLIAGGGHEPSERRLAREYADAWEREDYARMYSMLTAPSRAETSLRSFARQYRRARVTATLGRLRAGRPHSVREESVTVPFMVDTRVFGGLEAPVTLPLGEDRRRRAGRRLGAASRVSRAAAGRAAHTQHAHARARHDRGPRRDADRRGRGAAVQARPARIRDRRPRRPGAARACGGARGPRGAGRGAGRPDRARARVRRRARRHARRRAAGR